VTALASRRLRAYVWIGLAGALAGLILERPEPVVVAAPFLLACAVGLVLARQPRLEIDVELERERAVEGEEVGVLVRVTALQPAARVEVELVLPRGLELLPAQSAEQGGLRTGQTRVYRRRIRCRRWGGRLVGRLEVRARDPLGFFYYSQEARQQLPLRIYPRAETLRALVRPAETQVFAGNEVSRLRGDGIEFADIRPFLPGDRVRRVNWRATARRGRLHVNEMRPERNADLVIFLDTFVELGGTAEGSLVAAVRAAAALAHAYLSRRDRVGLIGFGGTLRWLTPQMGERQLYRLLDALIDTEIVLSYAWKGLEVIPRQILPPSSLVLAISPLVDARAVSALLELRGRGHDLAVLELSPQSYVSPGAQPWERIAYRLWRMERDALRARLIAMGVPTVAWSAEEPIQPALAVADRFRRDARVVRR
jgi:uncharacterized protein (DUF58 family)